jgi:cytochrome c2
MTPEYTAYQNSAHSRVNCVGCHIGSGASWFVKSKISGARQLFAVVADTFSRPIETPVHGLRPARDTCEQCHRPEKFHGDKLVVKDKFLEDENNTHVKTVLLLKIGSAGDQTADSHGIHWHVAPENEIVYKATDRQRNIIAEVSQKVANGSKIVYRSGDADEQLAEAEDLQERTMDCIDCHNRPSHIYLSAEQAIDNKLLTKAIPRDLPYIKQQAMRAVNVEYKSHDEAKSAIATELTNFYKTDYPDIYANNRSLVENAIAGVQAAYTENVFPEMRIQWNTYSSNIGHANEMGCFRCHNEELEAENGNVISMDCESCHTILAEEEENPEILETLLGG